MALTRLSAQLPKFYSMPGQRVAFRNFSTSSKFNGNSFLNSLKSKDRDASAQNRQDYPNQIPTMDKFVADPFIQDSRDTFVKNRLMKGSAQDPDHHKEEDKTFWLQDYVYLEAMVACFKAIIGQLDKKETDLIKFEEGRLGRLISYKNDLYKTLIELGYSEDTIKKATANKDTAAYITQLEAIAKSGNHFHWLCFMVACSRGWNEGARYWLKDPSTVKHGFFYDNFIVPSLSDDYSYEKQVPDDFGEDIIAVPAKSPLYPEVVDNYGNTLFKPADQDKWIPMSTANIDQWLDKSVGSSARKIGILIEMYICGATESERPGMIKDGLVFVKQGFECETAMWSACSKVEN